MSESKRVLISVQPKRVAVDETFIKISGQLYALYAAMDLESKLILDAELFGRHGTDPVDTFLHRLTEKHNFSDGSQKQCFWCLQDVRLVKAVLLVDDFDYQLPLLN